MENDEIILTINGEKYKAVKVEGNTFCSGCDLYDKCFVLNQNTGGATFIVCGALIRNERIFKKVKEE